MNIGKLARQQQMMYSFIDRETNRTGSSDSRTQLNSQLSVMNGRVRTGESAEDSVASMLKSMGISGLQGRTVREMAQYRMRVQNGSQTAKKTAGAEALTPKASAESAKKTADKAAAKKADGTDLSSLMQRFSVREQYTPISDKATETMQQLAIKDAKESAGGKRADSTARANTIREQLKDVEPSKRAAAFNTMNKVYESETERLGDYIKEKEPGWNDWGDKFDAAILDSYKAGVNIWI